MPDMLVRLYDLPPAPFRETLDREGIHIRRALTPDMTTILAWVRETFDTGWADQCAVCFYRQPVSCFVAVKDRKVIGFACYEATYRNFFGPTGVAEAWRGRGIGTHLLFACMEAMRDTGYAYAVIGSAGPVDFYAKTVGALVIEGSVPGIYRNLVEQN